MHCYRFFMPGLILGTRKTENIDINIINMIIFQEITAGITVRRQGCIILSKVLTVHEKIRSGSMEVPPLPAMYRCFFAYKDWASYI